MNQKKIPWWMPQIGGGEYALVKQVLDNNYTNQGPLTERFEAEIAKRLRTKRAIATNSGTVAIFLALKGLGVGAGDEVIVPDITYIATANAVTLAGATPVFVDVDASLMLDPQVFEKAITPKTKAVIPVHISGRSENLEEVVAIAKKRGLFVVEDAAEAFCSKKDGKFLGTFGNAGCFSLSPNKTITSGQGGFVVTDDEALYIRLRQLRNQGVEGRLSGGDDVHPTLGFNFKFTDLQAAVALGQMELLDKRLERMKRTHEIYKKELRGIPGFAIFECDTEAGEVPQWTDCVVEKRNELDAYLQEKGIDCRRFWFPMHEQPPYRGSKGTFTNSTLLNPKLLWLPSAFTMTDEDVMTVCKAIREFYQN
jgi:perosamine synthetase